jgi:hypothetical protein
LVLAWYGGNKCSFLAFGRDTIGYGMIITIWVYGFMGVYYDDLDILVMAQP